tara:strand:+ start:22592 stop:23389 length:798 start_codon:yes stop_codon:yes gene_type:complete
MQFNVGADKKPKKINDFGEVTFEKYVTGTLTETTVTQEECESYGFIYYDSKCWIKDKDSLEFVQPNNIIEAAVKSNISPASSHSLIVGSYNNLSGNVTNSIIAGSGALATIKNTIVLGGNATGDLPGQRQSTVVMFGRQTTVGTNKGAYINNTTNKYYPVMRNSAIYFHCDVLALRVGGSSGSGGVGDYASWVERGVIINQDDTLSISRERDAIKSSGTVTGWQPTAAVIDDNLYIKVKGAADMTIEWSITARLTQILTNVSLTP